MTESTVTLIQTLGFPIAAVVACAFFIYKIIIRDKDEAIAREEKLIEVNRETTEAIRNVASTLKETNQLNKELSETNRLLVEKVEGRLDNIGDNIEKILGNINNKTDG